MEIKESGHQAEKYKSEIEPKMKKIDSQQHFVQEFETLLKKIEENIADLSQYQRIEMDDPSVALAEKLNRLKLARSQVRKYLITYGNASEATWIGVRNEAQEVFKNARKIFLEDSEKILNS